VGGTYLRLSAAEAAAEALAMFVVRFAYVLDDLHARQSPQVPIEELRQLPRDGAPCRPMCGILAEENSVRAAGTTTAARRR
jgi:hypothetical protein